MQIEFKTKLTVFISDIQKDSPLFGPVGLRKGSVIQAINGCNISNTDDWNYCLKNLKYASPGYCVPNEVISENIANEVLFLSF